MRFLLLLLAGLALAPGAAAADVVRLTIDPVGDPVVPLAETRNLTVRIVAPCASVALATDAPATVTARVVPATIAPPASCEENFTAEAVLTLRVGANATAFVAIPVEVRAAAGDATTREAVAIVPGWTSILEATALEAVRIVPPQSAATFPIRIQNLGNGIAKVVFEIVDVPETWTAAMPNPVVLSTPTDDPERATAIVPFVLQSPYRMGYMNEVGATTMKISAVYALDPRVKGDEATVSLLATVRGWYLPAPGLAAAFAAVAVAAVVARAARDR